jgi:hypothetical protein
VIRTLVMRVAGMAESDLDQTISPVYKIRKPGHDHPGGDGDIQIHLRARSARRAKPAALLAAVADHRAAAR